MKNYRKNQEKIRKTSTPRITYRTAACTWLKLILPGCACFPDFLQNYSEGQILWSLCLVVFHALTLNLPIQTSLSVVPKLQVCVRSGEKCQIFRKTSTPPMYHSLNKRMHFKPFMLVFNRATPSLLDIFGCI